MKLLDALLREYEKSYKIFKKNEKLPGRELIRI